MAGEVTAEALFRLEWVIGTLVVPPIEMFMSAETHTMMLAGASVAKLSVTREVFNFAGMPMRIDRTLPKGVVEFRRGDKVESRIEGLEL